MVLDSRRELIFSGLMQNAAFREDPEGPGSHFTFHCDKIGSRANFPPEEEKGSGGQANEKVHYLPGILKYCAESSGRRKETPQETAEKSEGSLPERQFGDPSLPWED